VGQHGGGLGGPAWDGWGGAAWGWGVAWGWVGWGSMGEGWWWAGNGMGGASWGGEGGGGVGQRPTGVLANAPTRTQTSLFVNNIYSTYSRTY